MAQVAIPLVLLGTAYLLSNDKDGKESMTNIDEDNSLLREHSGEPEGHVEDTNLNMNNNENLSQYQDKYIIRAKTVEHGANSQFESLTGNMIKYDDINHNNMSVFYSNKTNGRENPNSYEGILDSYTGSGINDIEKKEVGSFFKPQENLQNIHGVQNNNDFYQSRVNESYRHANTKPWEEIKVGPGMDSSNILGSNYGFNNGIENRDSWKPKTVDELRAQNNPKLNFSIDNHQGPAHKPVQRGIMGKIVKKTPETYYVNDTKKWESGIGVMKGLDKPMQVPIQELTNENRETTSVSYYGAREAQDKTGYVNGEYAESHRIQLPTKPYTNLTNSNINPTSNQNYGKDGYVSYSNNRNTSRDSYFGNVTGTFMQNVVSPIVNGLKHTKKTNFQENSKQVGNINGNVKKSIVFNPNEHLSTTNREMTTEKQGMNYLNMERQTQDGHVTANPYLIGTQRQTTNKEHTGGAKGNLSSRSYQAEYNQRNQNKPYQNRTNHGNMSVFNGQLNATVTGREECNDRPNALYNPYNHTPDPSHLGNITNEPQQYKPIEQTYNNSDMLNAFKNNPYTQPLNSVA